MLIFTTTLYERGIVARPSSLHAIGLSSVTLVGSTNEACF